MIITGVTTQQFADIVAKVNAGDYAGNIVIETNVAKNVKGTRINVKLGTADNRAFGSKIAWSGRHGKWLCWHGFRDVFQALFDAYPDASIRSRDAVYKGKQNFEDTFEDTGWANCGSMFQPAYPAEMCAEGCEGRHTY